MSEENTHNPAQETLKKRRFSLGRQDFTVSCDPVTGRWKHNRLALDKVHHFSTEERTQFDITQIVCDLLSEGIAKDPAAAVNAGQKLWRYYIGQRTNLTNAGPEFMLAYLLLQQKHPWDDRSESYKKSRDRLTNLDDYEPLTLHRVDQAKWLRRLISIASSEHLNLHYSAMMRKVRPIISRFTTAWSDDPNLWREYAEWEMTPFAYNVSLSFSHQFTSILNNLLGRDYIPDWRLLWNAGDDDQPTAIRELYNVAHRQFKTKNINDIYLMLPAAPTSNVLSWSEMIPLNWADLVLASAHIKALTDDSPCGAYCSTSDMSFLAASRLEEAHQQFAWKMAFVEILAATKKSGSIAFGEGHSTLRSLCEAKYHKAAEFLFPNCDHNPQSLDKDAETYARRIEKHVYGGEIPISYAALLKEDFKALVELAQKDSE